MYTKAFIYILRFLFAADGFFWGLESNRSGSLLVRLYMVETIRILVYLPNQ